MQIKSVVCSHLLSFYCSSQKISLHCTMQLQVPEYPHCPPPIASSVVARVPQIQKWGALELTDSEASCSPSSTSYFGGVFLMATERYGRSWHKKGTWKGQASLLLRKKIVPRDFAVSPVVGTSPSNAGGAGSIRGWGAKISHASRPKKKKPKHKTEAIL